MFQKNLALNLSVNFDFPCRSIIMLLRNDIDDPISLEKKKVSIDFGFFKKVTFLGGKHENLENVLKSNLKLTWTPKCIYKLKLDINLLNTPALRVPPAETRLTVYCWLPYGISVGLVDKSARGRQICNFGRSFSKIENFRQESMKTNIFPETRR